VYTLSHLSHTISRISLTYSLASLSLTPSHLSRTLSLTSHTHSFISHTHSPTPSVIPWLLLYRVPLFLRRDYYQASRCVIRKGVQSLRMSCPPRFNKVYARWAPPSLITIVGGKSQVPRAWVYECSNSRGLHGYLVLFLSLCLPHLLSVVGRVWMGRKPGDLSLFHTHTLSLSQTHSFSPRLSHPACIPPCLPSCPLC
jgi:hypothetical protein